MEFKEAMRILKRMCAEVECISCPLRRLCSSNIKEHPEEAEAILAKWAEEHPEKTIMDDFFEKHPKAMRDGNGIPHACAKHCGYHAPTYCERIPQRCAECWRRPLEEVER